MAAGTNEIILRSSKDWDDWYEEVQMKATASNFHKYIDLDAERIDPSMEPDPYMPNSTDSQEVMHMHFYLYKQYPRQILEELKEFIAPTKRQREVELTELFLSFPSRPRLEWEDCHRLVLKYDVDEFTSEHGNLYRFLNAVQAIHPEFSDFRRQELENALENGDEPLSVRQMINHFRSHRRTCVAEDEPEYSKNNAVFSTYQDQSTKAESTKDSTKKTAGNARKCVCGGYHSYVKCWFLNAEKRPWVPKKEIEDKVKNALEDTQKKQAIENAFVKENKTLAVASIHTENNESDDYIALATTLFTADHATSRYQYPLRNSFVYDTGANKHVCNDRSRFENFEPCEGSYLYAGDSKIAIQGTEQRGVKRMLLLNVAYIPGFHTNIAASPFFKRKGLGIDELNHTIIDQDGVVRFNLTYVHEKYVLEYNPITKKSRSEILKINETMPKSIKFADHGTSMTKRATPKPMDRELPTPPEPIPPRHHIKPLNADIPAETHHTRGSNMPEAIEPQSMEPPTSRTPAMELSTSGTPAIHKHQSTPLNAFKTLKNHRNMPPLTPLTPLTPRGPVNFTKQSYVKEPCIAKALD
ncbi:hypothetical protein AJ78_06704 [Emergomyces pasteurianus Ep9510]|uniref:Retrovirus-related Pol polyprotein from transposon TNT 1-94-like beta-barrel domain-containing protein n=1 Tax=Emergomyces pasteurianus Ep9510 TaxID=1447872 RepID=A0A1J9P9X9_9EURO|nr:hypothetical protein AJ78_06704 [Emergomyces pasteurianus Ep9510]